MGKHFNKAIPIAARQSSPITLVEMERAIRMSTQSPRLWAI